MALADQIVVRREGIFKLFQTQEWQEYSFGGKWLFRVHSKTGRIEANEDHDLDAGAKAFLDAITRHRVVIDDGNSSNP